MKRSLLLPALVAGSLVSGAALAANYLQNDSFSRWKVQDKCIADSVKQHPDRTIESQKARDVSVDACLKAHGQPPREHVAPNSDTATAAPPAQSAKP